MATTMMGTPYYMSPEVMAGRPYSYASDVWALVSEASLYPHDMVKTHFVPRPFIIPSLSHDWPWRTGSDVCRWPGAKAHRFHKLL